MDGEKRYIVPVKYFVLGEATVVAALLGHSNTTMIHRHYSHVAQRTPTRSGISAGTVAAPGARPN